MNPAETSSERNFRLFGTASPVAFLTGSGAPRVGRRIAEYLLAENFRIMLHAHSASDEARRFVEAQRSRNRLVSMVTGSVDEEEQVAGWVRQTRADFERVDVVVNSAAIWEPQPLEKTESHDFERFFRVNSLGPALVCKHFGLALAAQETGGAIVNIGDWAVARPYRDFSAYFLSKGALVTVTQSMAVELATRNPRVRVNAILPGPVQLADGISAERRQQIIDDCLLQREGTADDVAHAVLFLATNRFVTGVVLPVDGGRTIYAGPTTDSIAHPDG